MAGTRPAKTKLGDVAPFVAARFSPDSPARKRKSIYVKGLWIPALGFAAAGITDPQTASVGLTEVQAREQRLAAG
jgi:hypothetical protein